MPMRRAHANFSNRFAGTYPAEPLRPPARAAHRGLPSVSDSWVGVGTTVESPGRVSWIPEGIMRVSFKGLADRSRPNPRGYLGVGRFGPMANARGPGIHACGPDLQHHAPSDHASGPSLHGRSPGRSGTPVGTIRGEVPASGSFGFAKTTGFNEGVRAARRQRANRQLRTNCEPRRVCLAADRQTEVLLLASSAGLSRQLTQGEKRLAARSRPRASPSAKTGSGLRALRLLEDRLASNPNIAVTVDHVFDQEARRHEVLEGLVELPIERELCAVECRQAPIQAP